MLNVANKMLDNPHMRKIVLGITALIAIQFAFITYMMVLQSRTELTSAPAPAADRPAGPDHIRIGDLNDSADVALDPEVAVPESGSQAERALDPAATVPNRAAKLDAQFVRRISKPAFNSATSRPANPGEFQSVVIRYNRNPDTEDCETPEGSNPKKRSLFAKAGPVFKQPWKWMKAVGSKLN